MGEWRRAKSHPFVPAPVRRSAEREGGKAGTQGGLRQRQLWEDAPLLAEQRCAVKEYILKNRPARRVDPTTLKAYGEEVMTRVRRTLASIRAVKPRTDRRKIAATAEADIRRRAREDDQTESDLSGFAPVIPPQMLRQRLGLTQDQFAKALRIPVSTLRNWEQGRVLPDPAARSLLAIVAKNPKAALKALAA